MDGWGLGIFIVGLVLYFLTKKKIALFLFVSGIGAGIFIGAIWSYLIVMNILP